MNNITIVEFPSNLGLKEPLEGHEPGVKKLPDWLRKYKFHDLLSPETIYRLNPPDYSMNLDMVSGVRNADNIVSYAKEQAILLTKLISKNKFPL